MSKNRRNFSPEFKTKLVIELLESGKTLNEIASKYDVFPKSLITWKKQFLGNASIVFEESVPSKKYKEKLKEKEEKIENLEKTLGRTIMERDWLSKKVGSSGLIKLSLVDLELPLSITRQCKLLEIKNRTSLYYKKISKRIDKDILNRMDEIYTESTYYGYRRIHQVLIQEGKTANPKQVLKLMRILGIHVIGSVKIHHIGSVKCTTYQC